jgi:hypothetical protein
LEEGAAKTLISFASMDNLSAETGFTPQWVRRLKNEMMDLGYLESKRRFQQPILYALHCLPVRASEVTYGVLPYGNFRCLIGKLSEFHTETFGASYGNFQKPVFRPNSLLGKDLLENLYFDKVLGLKGLKIEGLKPKAKHIYNSAPPLTSTSNSTSTANPTPTTTPTTTATATTTARPDGVAVPAPPRAAAPPVAATLPPASAESAPPSQSVAGHLFSLLGSPAKFKDSLPVWETKLAGFIKENRLTEASCKEYLSWKQNDNGGFSLKSDPVDFMCKHRFLLGLWKPKPAKQKPMSGMEEWSNSEANKVGYDRDKMESFIEQRRRKQELKAQEDAREKTEFAREKVEREAAEKRRNADPVHQAKLAIRAKALEDARRKVKEEEDMARAARSAERLAEAETKRLAEERLRNLDPFEEDDNDAEYLYTSQRLKELKKKGVIKGVRA